MGQFGFTTQGKSSQADAEAANTATKQNKNNANAAVDPKLTMKKLIGKKKNEVVRTLQCFLFISVLITIAFGGIAIFVQLNFKCQQILREPAFSGDSFIVETNELLSKNAEEQQKRFESLQKSYDLLKRKYDGMFSEYTEMSKRYLICENSKVETMSSMKAAYDDFVASQKKCNIVTDETPMNYLSDDQKFFEAIDFDPNNDDNEEITIHTQIQTELKPITSDETTQNSSPQPTKE